MPKDGLVGDALSTCDLQASNDLLASVPCQSRCGSSKPWSIPVEGLGVQYSIGPGSRSPVVVVVAAGKRAIVGEAGDVESGIRLRARGEPAWLWHLARGVFDDLWSGSHLLVTRIPLSDTYGLPS